MKARDIVGLVGREDPLSAPGLLRLAIEKGASGDDLEKIVGLYERMADRAAKREFALALREFQKQCPLIPKSSTAQIATKGGGTYSYKYAELDEIQKVIGPILHEHGLSFGWDSTYRENMLHCVCSLRHDGGHTETAGFDVPIESRSAMSEQQKHAAALTYARRQSLIQVLGLITTGDTDTDAVDPTTISEDQLTTLEDAFKDLRVSKLRFFRFLGMPEDAQLAQIRAVNYAPAINFLEAKRRAQEEKS